MNVRSAPRTCTFTFFGRKPGRTGKRLTGIKGVRLSVERTVDDVLLLWREHPVFVDRLPRILSARTLFKLVLKCTDAEDYPGNDHEHAEKEQSVTYPSRS
ncbi:hypothetical protein HAL_02070 [Haladaptatus sp. T7]|nr:hypothetical protein HAL_02070 [Haladaptatus sp. T7]